VLNVTVINCSWGCAEEVYISLRSCFLLTQVLKVAILAEKYASDYTWYVDTILHLIRIAGDHVSEEVCCCLLLYIVFTFTVNINAHLMSFLF